MFVITGHRPECQQVKIFDLVDKSEEWVTYNVLSRGIKQGLPIQGITNRHIMLTKSNIVKSLAKQLQFAIAKSIALRDMRPLYTLLKPYGLVDTIEDVALDGNKLYLYKVCKVITQDKEFTAFNINSMLEESAEPKVAEIIAALRSLLSFYNFRIPLELTHIIEVDYRSYKALLGNISVDFETGDITDVFNTKGETHLAGKPSLSHAYKDYLARISKSIQQDGLGAHLHDIFIFMPTFNNSESSKGYFMREVAPKYIEYKEDVLTLDIIFGESWHKAQPTDYYYDEELIHLINFNKKKYTIIQDLQCESDDIKLLMPKNESDTKAWNKLYMKYMLVRDNIGRIKQLDEPSFMKEFGNRL